MSNQLRIKPTKAQIDAFFHPKNIAVFGASTNPQKSGYLLVQNLLTHNFKGKIYPINPKPGSILGVDIVPSVMDIQDQIDLAIIFVPNKQIPSILTECVKKGVKAAIIEAAGFEEVPDGGQYIEHVKNITENFTKIRIIGPNCTGITYIEQDGVGMFSSFVPMPAIKTGPVAIISQSGFTNGGFFLDNTSRNPNLGFKYVCAIGNKMDLDENDLLEYISEDPSVSVIALYIESFRDVRRLIELSKLAQEKHKKKVILLRSGLSQTGANATASHTGVLAKEKTELIKAVIKQARCILADDFRNLFQLVRTSAFLSETQTIPRNGNNVAIITVSGGAGAVLADICETHSIKIPELEPKLFIELSKIYPKWMPPNKFALLDIWPAVENAAGDYQTIMLKSLEIALADENIQGLFITAFYSKTTWKIDWFIVKELINKFHKPIFVWLFGQYSDVLEAERIFQELKLPTFNSEREMVETWKKITS